MLLPAVLALSLAAPRWLDRMIAGYAIAIDAPHDTIGVHDAARGFYLVRTIECDGAIISLTLTRDRNVVAEAGFAVPNFTPRSGDNGSLPLVSKPLRSLATGKGVLIGDAPSSVVRRLGAPTVKKDHRPFLDYVYRVQLNEEAKTSYEQRYTFKGGRLIEIQFGRDASAE